MDKNIKEDDMIFLIIIIQLKVKKWKRRTKIW